MDRRVGEPTAHGLARAAAPPREPHSHAHVHCLADGLAPPGLLAKPVRHGIALVDPAGVALAERGGSFALARALAHPATQ